MPDPADLQTGLARPTPAAVPDLGLDSSLRNAAAAAPIDPGSNVVTFPSPRQSGPAPSGRPSATDMLQYLLDKGETPVVAQGIVNRLAKESSFNPLEIGDNGTSFGLAQWHNERAVGLFNYR